MRVVTLALVSGLLSVCASLSGCASGFERNGDDDDQPRIDAPPFTGNGDGGFTVDAPVSLVDAPSGLVDAPLQTDAPSTGGINCPDTIDYYFRAIDEIANNPNFVDCTSGADCSTSQCCYGALVCVAYP